MTYVLWDFHNRWFRLFGHKKIRNGPINKANTDYWNLSISNIGRLDFFFKFNKWVGSNNSGESGKNVNQIKSFNPFFDKAMWKFDLILILFESFMKFISVFKLKMTGILRTIFSQYYVWWLNNSMNIHIAKCVKLKSKLKLFPGVWKRILFEQFINLLRLEKEWIFWTLVSNDI